MKTTGPAKWVERIVAILLPPACREEVLGDLHERYESPGQYALDAMSTVPLVILSRIRRTTEPRMVLMQAFVMYLSFVGAAWWQARGLPREELGMARLAVPAVLALIGILLEGAYSRARTWWRGPLVGTGLVWGLQGLLGINGWVVSLGCGIAFVLSAGIHMLLPPGYGLIREGRAMNPKIVVYIVIAFVAGLGIGVVSVSNHNDWQRLLIKALPFLLLLMFWIVLMMVKMTKRSR